MRPVAGAMLLAFAALAQVTWAPRVDIAGAFPNLVLLTVIATAWVQGTRAGLVSACVGGLLLDLASAGPVGPHVLGLLVPVYALGFWTRNVERAGAVHVALSVVLATVVYSLLVVATRGVLGLPLPAPLTLAQMAAAAALYNAALSPFMFEVVRRLDAFGRPGRESD